MPYHRFILSLSLFAAGCTSTYQPKYTHVRPPQNQKEILTPLSPGHIGARELLSGENIQGALKAYLSSVAPSQKHEMATLGKIAQAQILEGLKSGDLETQLLSIFSITIGKSEQLIPALEEALGSPFPEVQVAALRALASFSNDRATKALYLAMRSNFLGIRIEASIHLAEQKCIDAADQIEALMHKSPEPILPLFCYLFAKSGSRHDIDLLAQLMNHASPYVRSSALLYAALFERSSLEKHLFAALNHTHPLELETAAFAMGHLHIERAKPRLKQLLKSSSLAVHFAAAKALEALHDPEALKELKKLAKKGDLFAIQTLGNQPGSEPVLLELLKHQDADVSINSAVALLHLKNTKGLPLLTAAITRPDVGFAEHKLPAHSASVFVRAPIHSKSIETNPGLPHTTLAFKGHVITLCMNLPDELFLPFIDELIESHNSEAVSFAADALAMRGSESGIDKLKVLRQTPGAPWTRMRSSLALFKITRDIKYLQEVKGWLLAHADRDIIELMPYSSAVSKGPQTSLYALKANEKSALLIEAWMTLAHSESEEGLNLILEAFSKAPKRARIVLAGLLIKAIQ